MVSVGCFEAMSKSLQRIVLAVLIVPAAFGASGADDTAYTVKPGDILKVSVWKEPDLTGQVIVRPDGGFSFPLVGEVDARGKSVAELQQIVGSKLQGFISDPVVTVAVDEIHGNKVYVIGQVRSPGEFAVDQTVDVMQALSMAGGTTPFAKLDDIRILRRSADSQVALKFSYSDVAKGQNLGQNIKLEAGDVVVVP